MAKELKIRITGDASGLKKATDDGIGILGDFGSKISALSVATGTLLADGLKAGFGKAVSFLGDSIGAAADINETISKVGVLFGSAAGDIEKFAADAANNLGQSKKQALDAAATFAVFGKSAGLGGKDLAGFSTGLVTIASDLASIQNTSPEDAIQAIGAALRGEQEGIRRYGILLDDASLRQKALELGIVSSTKDALTPQQKVLAAQQAIIEGAAYATDDFKNTSQGLAGQQKILAANVDNLKTRIGTALLPTVLTITQAINQKVIPALSAWAEKYGPRVEAALSRLGGWIQKVVGLFQSGGLEAAGGEVVKKLVTALAAFEVWGYGTFLPAVGRLLLRVGRAFGEWIGDTAIPYLQANLPIWLAAFGDWFSGTALPWLGEQGSALAQKLGGWIGEAAQSLRDNLPQWLESLTAWAIGTALPEAGRISGEFARAFAAWVLDASIDLQRKLPGWLASLAGWFASDALPALNSFGRDMAHGLVDGIVSGLWSLAGRLVAEVRAFISANIPAPVRELLKIGSPSKVFAGFGRNIAEGLALGMTQSVGMVSQAAQGLANAAMPIAPTGFGAIGAAGYAAGDSGGGWSAAPIVVETYLDGRQIATSLAPHQRQLERSKR